MVIQFGTAADIDNWMRLVEQISWNFPGLETMEKLAEYRQTVLRFISKNQALCAKDTQDQIIGVLLFSRSHNMICCLGVSPEHRRCGVASHLLSLALEQLDGTKVISVSTFRENDAKGIAPRALYKKFGFVEDKLTVEFEYPNQVFLLHPQNGHKCAVD